MSAENLHNEEEAKSSLYQIVGLNEENREFAKEDFQLAFEDQDSQDWEREKTPEEREIIDDVLKRIPEFVKQFGGKRLPITQDHIHIIDEQRVPVEQKPEFATKAGGFDFVNQAIEIYPLDAYGAYNKLHFAQSLVHELMHFCSFHSIQMHPENDIVIERRSGFSARLKDSTEFYFSEIDEALVDRAMILFGEKYFSEIPQLAQDLEYREFIKDLIVKDGSPDSAKMVSYINKIDGKNFAVAYGYYKEMGSIDKLFENLYQSNQKTVSSKKEVEDLFLNGLFTGKMLEIARMAKRFGGKKSPKLFRQIGEVTKKDRGFNE